MIALSTWSRGLRELGYESQTLVTHVYAINRREDFDRLRSEFLRRVPYADVVRDLVVFAWALRRADVFVTYLDGGYLGSTPIRWAEGGLLRLAAKKLIVTPYGSDIAVPGHMGVAERALLRDYPQLAQGGERRRRRVDWFCRWADLVVGNYQYGYLPRVDVAWPTMVAIDTDRWTGDGSSSAHDGRDGPVTVVHAPNHRHVKGTELLQDAVERLRGEGLDVRLKLLERRPNEEVRAAVHSCDVVAEQFVAGYGLFAIEGMAAGKPVLSALSAIPDGLRPFLEPCPIVDADERTLADRLRELVTDPPQRERLGRAGREFAVAHHSQAAVARVWEGLIQHVWAGVAFPESDDVRPVAPRAGRATGSSVSVRRAPRS